MFMENCLSDCFTMRRTYTIFFTITLINQLIFPQDINYSKNSKFAYVFKPLNILFGANYFQLDYIEFRLEYKFPFKKNKKPKQIN
jgi:hypothetical protein